MKFRKKNKREASEVFTDSLNDILFILLMFFLFVTTLANPNVVPVTNPTASKESKAKQDITVSIDKDQRFYIGSTQADPPLFDSLLSLEIRKQKSFVDTPTVVINADTSTFYGAVFHVMNIARNDTAKVVARVKKQ